MSDTDDDQLFPPRPIDGPRSRTSHGYGIEALVQLAAESSGLGSYTYERYQLLRRLLDVKVDLLAKGGGPEALELQRTVDERGRRSFRTIGSPDLAHQALIKSRGVPDPFSRYLEAPPDIHVLYQAHAAEISARAADLNRALRDLAVAALVSAQPEVADRTVTMAELRAAGWPDPPPPSQSFDDDSW